MARVYHSRVFGQPLGAGVGLEAGYPPRFGSFILGPLDFLCPALTLIVPGYVPNVVLPPTIISSPDVVTGRQKPPGIIDADYFVTDFLELLRVLVVGARPGRDDAERVCFFFNSSGGSSTFVLYSWATPRPISISAISGEGSIRVPGAGMLYP